MLPRGTYSYSTGNNAGYTISLPYATRLLSTELKPMHGSPIAKKYVVGQLQNPRPRTPLFGKCWVNDFTINYLNVLNILLQPHQHTMNKGMNATQVTRDEILLLQL